MSGPARWGDAPPHSPMCDRCSSRWTARLEVDTFDPADQSPSPPHHVTVMYVCAEHITAGILVMLTAIGARPGRPGAMHDA